MSAEVRALIAEEPEPRREILTKLLNEIYGYEAKVDSEWGHCRDGEEIERDAMHPRFRVDAVDLLRDLILAMRQS